MPGPPPKRTSRRSTRSGSGHFTSLPAEGRTGEVPPWPLGRDLDMQSRIDFAEDSIAALTVEIEMCDDSRRLGGLKRKRDQASNTRDLLKIKLDAASSAELSLWEELWGTPQAVMWDESPAFGRVVAQFVRWNIRAEQGDLKAATEARLQGQQLGLTPLSLLRLRKEVEEAEKAEESGNRRREKRDVKPGKKDGPPPGDPRIILFPGA